jgi:hypothetical protein
MTTRATGKRLARLEAMTTRRRAAPFVFDHGGYTPQYDANGRLLFDHGAALAALRPACDQWETVSDGKQGNG